MSFVVDSRQPRLPRWIPAREQKRAIHRGRPVPGKGESGETPDVLIGRDDKGPNPQKARHPNDTFRRIAR